MASEWKDSPSGEGKKQDRAMTGPSVEKTHPGTGLFLAVENIFGLYLNAAIILIVMFFIATEIFSRFLINYSFLGVVDIVELAVLVLAFTSLGVVQRDDAHIRVDLIEKKLEGKRSGYALNIFNRLFTLVVSIVMFYIALMAALTTYQDNILTWMIFWPKWPAVIFVPIGWLLLIIRIAIQVKKEIVSARPR